MSSKALKAFHEKFSQDPKILEQLKTAKNKDDQVKILTQFAKTNGYDVSEADFNELNAEELDKISGGITGIGNYKPPIGTF